MPLSVNRQTVVFPGFDGGAEWGGQAFDPDSGLYYVNANDLAWTGGLAPNTGGQSGQALYLQHCATCHRDDRVGAPPSIPTLIGIGDRRTFAEITSIVRQGAGRMPGFPTLDQPAVNAIVQYTLTGADEPPPRRGTRARRARRRRRCSPLANNSFRFTGYRRFMDPDGFPATAPPWGTLSAINLNTGDYAWQVPLGEYPELVAQGLRNTGSENYGGPVVTAGGLVFIGATNADRKLRAFDKSTGTLLWETVMAGPGRATPAMYEAGGRQFVVIATGTSGPLGRRARARRLRPTWRSVTDERSYVDRSRLTVGPTPAEPFDSTQYTSRSPSSESEPGGTSYSNSIVAWMFHLLSRMSWSTSTIGVSPVPNGTFGPSFSFRSFTCTCVMRA